MFHTAKQESLEHIITATKHWGSSRTCWEIVFFQRSGVSAGLLCSREQAPALEQGAAFLLLRGMGWVAGGLQEDFIHQGTATCNIDGLSTFGCQCSVIPTWLGALGCVGVGGTWSIHICVLVLWCRNLVFHCRFWRAVSTVLTDKGAAWKMRSKELPSEAGNSIPWSFHPSNLTAAQLGAAVPLSLSIHLHVKQQMIAGNCTILSSSSRILLTALLNQAFPHCCGDAGRCPALSDLKPALDFWESVKIQRGRHNPSLFLAPPFSCWAAPCAPSPVWQCWIWEGQSPGANPGSCKGWREWGWPNSLWFSSRDYRWWKQNAFSALAWQCLLLKNLIYKSPKA